MGDRARWYSDSAAPSPKEEAKQAAGEKIQEDEVLKSSTSAEGTIAGEVEKLKSELEAKKKEITNLKVCVLCRHLIVYQIRCS